MSHSEMSHPKYGAGPIEVRRGAGEQVMVWVDGWCVRKFQKAECNLWFANTNQAHARLAGDWFDLEMYRAIARFLRDEKEKEES